MREMSEGCWVCKSSDAAKTGADGKFTVTWPEAGMYWINTAWRAGGPAPEGMGRGGPPVASASYVAVFEVLP